MKKILFVFGISICLIFNAKAQLNVSLTSNHGNDTIKTCIDTVITFYAATTNNGLDITENVNYSWDFNDGTTDSGIDLDTIQHTFTKYKGFRVSVKAEYNGNKDYDILPLEIGLEPDFSEVKTDIDTNFTGICPGEEFTLFGKTNNSKWEYNFNPKIIQKFPYLVETTDTYISTINLNEFQKSDIISNIENIDSIEIKIEHENLANIQIKLTCPNANELILKDFGGEPKYLGEPKIGDVGDQGVPYIYWWNNTPDFGTINSESLNYETMPSGIYQPENSFTNLLNCPLNGDWILTVTDNTPTQNGFVFEWGIYFNKSILPDTFKYENNYDYKTSAWAGEGVNSTNLSNGNAVVNPPIGELFYDYNFYISDNFGCPNHTSLNVAIENAKMTIDKEGINLTGNNLACEIGDKLTFKDSTSWAVEYLWDFGDESDNSSEKEQIHYYIERGDYRVLLQAISKKGCVDFDTVFFNLIAKDTVEMFVGNYILTPNDDGVNDYFSLFDGDEQYPGGSPIDSLSYTWIKSIDKDASNISDFSGKIFDRYGNTVCVWNTVEEGLHGWDGTVNNNGNRFVSDGFYFYVAVAKMKNEKKDKLKPYKGTIYVIKKL